MRLATALIFLAFVAIALWAIGASPRSLQTPSVSVAIYDENPSHIWNRLYEALWVREDPQTKANRYGEDSLDPMLWRQSEHLLSQPSHGVALRVLDEFLRTHAEKLIQEPLKRAVLQRDLWAVFDWSVQQSSWKEQPGYGDEKRDLQTRLAEVVSRLALTQEQIKSLPDNYAQAVASGAFARKYDPTQPQQPSLPDFPSGTHVALARQMMLFDTQGSLVVSPITESVQIRVYRKITTARARDFSAGPAGMTRSSGQDFFEIKIRRPLLFSGKQGGLRATTRDEIEPPTFQTMGFDLIDAVSQRGDQINTRFAPTMQACLHCHSGGGISSFNSIDSLLKPTRLQQEPQDVNYGPRYWSNSNAVWWKESHYDWGLLNGYWKASR